MEEEHEFDEVVGHRYAPGHEPDPYLELLQRILEWAMSFWGAVAIALGTAGVLLLFMLVRMVIAKLKEKRAPKKRSNDQADKFRKLRKTREG